MTQPNYSAYAEQKSGASATVGNRKPRRTGRMGVVACAGLVLLCSMCLRSSWDGSGARDLSAQERSEALTMPPSMVSEQKRQAVVGRDTQDAMERIDRLVSIAAEDSPAGRDAKRALERLYETLRAALGR